MTKYNLHSAIPAAIFVALEGLYAVNVMAGEGVVVLTRDVPARPAYKEGVLGIATIMDVSPDDKVEYAMNGSQSITKSTELADTDFSEISTGSTQGLTNLIVGNTAEVGSHKSDSSNNVLNAVGRATELVSSLPNTNSFSYGKDIGGATGQMTNSISLATGSVGGLIGVLSRISGQ